MRHPHPSRGIPLACRAAVPRTIRIWRRQQLIDVGLDELTAHRLSGDDTIDFHDLVSAAERRITPTVTAADPTVTTAEEPRASGGRDE